jgi:hypothetical protein
MAVGSDLFVYIKGSTFPDRPDAGPGWVPVCLGLVLPEGKKVRLASRAELMGAMDWPPSVALAACARHAARRRPARRVRAPRRRCRRWTREAGRITVKTTVSAW